MYEEHIKEYKSNINQNIGLAYRLALYLRANELPRLEDELIKDEYEPKQDARQTIDAMHAVVAGMKAASND